MSLLVLALLVLIAAVVLGLVAHPLWFLLLIVAAVLLWQGSSRGSIHR